MAMEKKYIIQFLKEGKRGVYKLIVNVYGDAISAMGITMALRVIKDDLEKEAGTTVELNYFSLAKAASKLEKKSANHSTPVEPRKWKFKDSHEEKESQTAPGRFKIDKSD
jgi:hypothetical protein